MTFDQDLSICMPLIREFCDERITASEFERRYSEFWEQCRDDEYIAFQAYKEKQLQFGEDISEGWLLKCFFSLMPPEKEQKLSDIFNRIYTACDCYWEDVSDEELDPPLVINDRMLLEEVRGMLKEIEDILAKKRNNR